MLGVLKIGTYLPPGRQENAPLAGKFGFDDDFLATKIGVMQAARKAPEQETSDLAVEAFKDLEAKSGLDRATVDVLVVVTQNPDGRGLPHCSAVVHKKLGLAKSCFAFDISLGCSGFVAGLAAIQGFMQVTGGKTGVLVTADPYSKVLDPDDKNTVMIFGDGATATLVGESATWTLGRFDLGTEGARNEALMVMPNGLLHMNGRAVFDFCALNVPGSVNRTLAANGLTKDQVDRFLLHPGSRFIVDTVAKRLGLGEVPFPAGSYGNTVSSSIPMMLAELDPATAPTVLISGFGVGLGWATTVLKGQ